MRESALAVEPVDVVRFQGSVGRKIKTVFRGDKRDRPSLLVALQHGVN